MLNTLKSKFRKNLNQRRDINELVFPICFQKVFERRFLENFVDGSIDDDAENNVATTTTRRKDAKNGVKTVQNNPKTHQIGLTITLNHFEICTFSDEPIASDSLKIQGLTRNLIL